VKVLLHYEMMNPFAEFLHNFDQNSSHERDSYDERKFE
jgi:hypothetical protein